MYNLIDRGFLPMIGSDGAESVGFLDALIRAHELVPAFVDPLQEAALLRQLVAMVLDAFGYSEDEREWADRWSEGRFNESAVRAYLEPYRDRFDLFDPERPAYQVGGLTALSGDTKPSSLLIPSAATGNNVPLFAARLEDNPQPLTPPEAALAVIAAHAWDTAAIKTGAVGDGQAKVGKTTGNPTGPLGQLGVVIPTGRTLFETLMLNRPLAGRIGGDADGPWWRREPEGAQWQTRSARGLLDLLTWQSRRIRLIPKSDADGAVTVSQVVLAAGDRLERTPHDVEPHTRWKQVDKPKPGDPAWRPVPHQSGQSLWRGLPGLLAVAAAEGGADAEIRSSNALNTVSQMVVERALPEDYPLGVLAVGVKYGNQFAVVENVIADRIPLPVAALTKDPEVRGVLLQIVDQADQLRQALNKLGDNVRRASGGDPVPWDKSQRPGDRFVTDLDHEMRRLLAGLQAEPGKARAALAAWAAVARSLAVQAGSAVLATAPPDSIPRAW